MAKSIRRVSTIFLLLMLTCVANFSMSENHDISMLIDNWKKADFGWELPKVEGNNSLPRENEVTKEEALTTVIDEILKIKSWNANVLSSYTLAINFYDLKEGEMPYVNAGERAWCFMFFNQNFDDSISVITAIVDPMTGDVRDVIFGSP